jgi:hypothetical protein
MKKVPQYMVRSAFISIGILLLVTSVRAESDFQVKQVIIAKTVTNRNPEGIFTPPAYCEKDKNGQAAIPVVKTAQTSKVVFWAKVAAKRKGTLRHSWHHQIEGTWTKVSEVNLSIRPSSGYRMWSLKSLKPEIHLGEWMIVVAPSNTPEEILCITRFTVH